MSATDGKKKGEKKSDNATTDAAAKEWTDSLEEDYQRIWSVGEECVTESELKKLLLFKKDSEQSVILYDGFEPSGRMHIAQGIFKAMNVNKCTQMVTPNLNANFVFWVADWFALMNDKMGGDLHKIKIVGEYLQQVWGAAGMDLSKVSFLWASDEITNKANVYWPLMLDIARRFNITRIKKCCQIMGRLEGSLTAAQILYPLMQCTDVFFLKSDICQLGVDQRKVNMLAREYCDHAKKKHKPIILSHHMLFGLKKGQEKMSKSDPDSAIFMEDSVEDVQRKITNAYCPSVEEEAAEQQQTGQADDDAGKESMHLIKDDLKNPCLDYIKYIIFSSPKATFTVSGGKVYTDFDSVRDDFLNGTINETQLKGGLIDALNVLLKPVREHFTKDENAKNLLAQVQQFKKESKTIVKDKVIRRLNMVELGKVEKDCSVVFAPMPVANPTLQDAVDVYIQLQHAVKAQSSAVLFLSDWSAKVCSACDADAKVINSFYAVFLTALKALDTGLIMDKVKIIYQSEAILSDPSNYWISVINIGRHFSLKDVMGTKMKDSDNAGIVISRLMFVADIMGLQPKYVSLLTSSSLVEKDADVEKLLISSYFTDDKLATLETPTILLFGDSSSSSEENVIKRPALRLQQERELEAHKTENDEYFLLDDPKVHGKSKLKKAFCEPGNVTFCPPISLASAFTFDIAGDDPKEIVIKRTEENGGDITFKSQDEITESFKTSSLHPGDLKAASTLIMVSILEKLATAIKADKDTLKASKALKAYQKKKNKQQSQKKKIKLREETPNKEKKEIEQFDRMIIRRIYLKKKTLFFFFFDNVV